MARAKKEEKNETIGNDKVQDIQNMIDPYDQGIISGNPRYVIVNALVETTGQVRFGDGTEVNLTITEKDLIPTSDGKFVEKVVFSGSKRRGVDRRTIHTLRNQILQNQGNDNLFEKCYIPELCRECPTCWLLGATAMGEGYNIKSRILYGSAYSIEPSDIAIQPHSRNMVNEQTQTTAGEAGIHTEEFIKGGVHFPTITTLERVVDWEIGAFAHAFLENINQNKYTAASRSQGGVKFTDADWGATIIVDESPIGMFLLPTPKIGAEKITFKDALEIYKAATDLDEIKRNFEKQGFTVEYEKKDGKDDELILLIKQENFILFRVQQANSIINVFQCISKEKKDDAGDVVKDIEGELVIENEYKFLQARFYGNRALGYLREKQLSWKTFLETFDQTRWETTKTQILKKIGVLSGVKEAPKESPEESIEEEQSE
ncbi:MAG: type I-D CRISPR-associated protein Cas7/Csc2 [Deltaproteobacteria bacterium]|nr:type I-D CRISPR-associated protein Cas7/Csc2 [Deltaproteobacteria bacterium]